MLRRTMVHLVLLAGLAGGCAAEPPRTFDTAIRDGASCAELFEIRNRETNGQTIERMNQRLRNIGCHSSTSTRNS